MIGANVSLKSIPFCWRKPLAHSLALYLGLSLVFSRTTLNTHFESMSHVLPFRNHDPSFVFLVSSKFSIALIHFAPSAPVTASWYDFGGSYSLRSSSSIYLFGSLSSFLSRNLARSAVGVTGGAGCATPTLACCTRVPPSPSTRSFLCPPIPRRCPR